MISGRHDSHVPPSNYYLLKRILTLRTLPSMHLPTAVCALAMPLAVCKKDVRTSFFPGKRNCSVVLHEIAVSGCLKLPDGD
jgi:hypothetical protein